MKIHQLVLQHRLCILCIFLSSLAHAGPGGSRAKFDAVAGMFSLTSTTTRTSASVSGIGSYQIAYRTSIFPSTELMVGYSLIASKIVTGDMGFGPDLGLLYFPMTQAAPITADTEGLQFRMRENLKPFFGVAFHQRQYQSTQSTYAGFSLNFGSEYSLHDNLSLKVDLRYIRLIGPGQATATEIDLLGGVTIHW